MMPWLSFHFTVSSESRARIKAGTTCNLTTSGAGELGQTRRLPPSFDLHCTLLNLNWSQPLSSDVLPRRDDFSLCRLIASSIRENAFASSRAGDSCLSQRRSTLLDLFVSTFFFFLSVCHEQLAICFYWWYLLSSASHSLIIWRAMFQVYFHLIYEHRLHSFPSFCIPFFRIAGDVTPRHYQGDSHLYTCVYM